MRCAHRGADARPSARFCEDCGERLELRCPAYNAVRDFGGTVLVGEETDLSTRQRVDYHQVTPIYAKGKDRSVLAWEAVEVKNLPRERPLFEECLADARARGDAHSVGAILRSLGDLIQLRGDFAGAAGRLQESMRLIREIDDQPCTTSTLDCFGMLALAQGQAERAARLWAAAETSRQIQGLVLSHAERERLDQTIAEGRAQLGDESYDTAWAEGSAMSTERAVEYALNEVSSAWS